MCVRVCACVRACVRARARARVCVRALVTWRPHSGSRDVGVGLGRGYWELWRQGRRGGAKKSIILFVVIILKHTLCARAGTVRVRRLRAERTARGGEARAACEACARRRAGAGWRGGGGWGQSRWGFRGLKRNLLTTTADGIGQKEDMQEIGLEHERLFSIITRASARAGSGRANRVVAWTWHILAG